MRQLIDTNINMITLQELGKLVVTLESIGDFDGFSDPPKLEAPRRIIGKS